MKKKVMMTFLSLSILAFTPLVTSVNADTITTNAEPEVGPPHGKN